VVRGDEREEAILLSMLELVAEVGYDQLTMDAVAARAHASKATIYRRWSNKAELVVAAVKRHAVDRLDSVDTGDLHRDLVDVLTAMRDRLEGQDATLLLGLIAAMRRNAELADVVRSQLITSKRAAFGDVVERAVARGQLPVGTDHALAAEIAAAVLLSRLLITGQPLDDAFIRQLVDGALIPALKADNDT
jgi:AcrR family transcriptional regulator